MTTCRIPGCDRPGAKRTRNGRVTSYSMCGGHRNRYYKYGDAMADVPIRPQVPHGEGWITPAGYHMRCITGHPLAPKSGHVFTHRVVLYDALGPGAHPCHWCGERVAWEMPQPVGLEVDHLNGVKTDNRVENLVPACNACNSGRRHAGNPLEWSPANG